MKKIYIFLSILITFLFPSSLFAADIPDANSTTHYANEQILNFNSDIVINNDSTINVTETIKVVALGNTIKRGIYRDFPTTYTDKLGNKHKVGFKIDGILKDGVPEDYHTENMTNGIRVYFGNANIYLTPGVYTYTFAYSTNRQIGYFDDHDELYWNVTGNGWVFPIDNAGAHVSFQSDIAEDSLKASGYTGYQGSKGIDLVYSTARSSALFLTTRPLAPTEGLTIVVEFPKGIVHEPTQWEYVKYFFADNMAIGGVLLILILILLNYYSLWNMVGRDPKPRSIIAQYEAPRGLSPGAVRYLSKMMSDSKLMTAAIISMAVKGFLKIDELKINYRLTQIGTDNTFLSEEEKTLAQNLFANSDTFEVGEDNYIKLMACKTAINKTLSDVFKETYFVLNGKFFAKGIAFSFIGIMIILLFEYKEKNALVVIASFIFIVAINILFARLLPRRTIEGRLVEDEIEGFKLFLSVTEKDRMNFHNPPERTPELFERFLPYALALEVENKWAKQFDDVFSKLGPNGYKPQWYHGDALLSGSMGVFVSSLGVSMNDTISSSSQPPGSSSGGGGGGFSGGGGGGGGGGGW